MYNWKYCFYLISAALIVFSTNCSYLSGNDYSGLIKKELAKGIRVDSLFLGMHFGMSSKQFYGYCWELNKKGLLTDGNNNTAVLYKPGKQLKFPASMTFYPDFYENKIYTMRVSFQYDSWAPWNKGQYSDTLLPDVLKMLKQWYPNGNDFLEINDKTRGTIYVKVDGNRRIAVGKFNDMLVKVDYTDLLIEQKLKK